MWKQTPEEWKLSSLFSSVIIEVKSTVEFYSLYTLFKVFARVDARVNATVDARVDVNTQTNDRMDERTKPLCLSRQC